MHGAIRTMLERYHCIGRTDYENALKEIIQEVALLGLWRQKFFEHALFYGGTALRVLHGLPRFSEDLDFSLLSPNANFDFRPFHRSISSELQAFGFSVSIEAKERDAQSQIESAFIKAGTKIHLIKLHLPSDITDYVQTNEVLKIKFEADIDPPGGFSTDVRVLLQPTTFQVKTMSFSDLFASKIHAVLARRWQNRVKGRDYYDLIWFVGRGARLNLAHLRARMVQSGHWPNNKKLSHRAVLKLLNEKFSTTDFSQARRDVSPFLRAEDQAGLDLWSEDFFSQLVKKIPVSD